jgi:TolB protein
MVDGAQQLFTVRSDGSGERQLTFAGDNFHPAWSKDGSRLLFTSTRSGAPSLWIAEPDGTNATRLTAGTGDFVADWSYDGTRIAFTSVRQNGAQPEIWIMNADGSAPGRLTHGAGSVHPSFAPGDGAIYYGAVTHGAAQVWGMLPNGDGKEQKTNGLGPGFPEANVPEWSRGGILAFWSGIEGQYGEVWTLDLAGGVFTRLTETRDPRNSDNPSWSPDGRQVLFDSNRNGSAAAIYVVGADGSDLRELIPGAFGQTAWQPVIGRPRRPRR